MTTQPASKLIFLGGAPGIGKSAVARKLYTLLDNCIWLDGDDVWRMHPFEVNPATKTMTEQNIQHLLRSYLTQKVFTDVLTPDQIAIILKDKIIAGN